MEVNKFDNLIKEKLRELHQYYNMCVDNYEVNGEEDFNCWLNIFMDK